MKRNKVLGAGVAKVTETGLGSVLNLIGCEDGVSYLQQSPSVIKQKHGLRVAVPPPPSKGETEASAMHSWITLDTQLKFVHVNSLIRRIILFCRPQAFLMYVENLEMDNSLKWVPLNVVSGQITSDAL